MSQGLLGNLFQNVEQTTTKRIICCTVEVLPRGTTRSFPSRRAKKARVIGMDYTETNNSLRWDGAQPATQLHTGIKVLNSTHLW